MCDFVECTNTATKVLSNEQGPFCKLCDGCFAKVDEHMKDGGWNLLLDRHVHTIVSLVEKDPVESILPDGFVPLAKMNGSIN